jgi:hypothetical protein
LAIELPADFLTLFSSLNSHMQPRFWALKALKIAFFVALFVIVAGYVTMALWNHLIPAIFHGPFISFGQAIGLLVLCRLLTGFRPGGGWGRQHEGGPWAAGREMWRAKMDRRLSTMTETQRAEFRARMAKCGGPWAKWAEGSTAPEPTADAVPPPANYPA